MASIIARNAAMRGQVFNNSKAFNTRAVPYDYSNFNRGGTLPGTINQTIKANSKQDPSKLVFKADVHSEGESSLGPSDQELADLLPKAPLDPQTKSPSPPSNPTDVDLDEIKPQDTITQQSNEMFSTLESTAETAGDVVEASEVASPMLPLVVLDQLGKASASLATDPVKDQISNDMTKNSFNPDPAVRNVTQNVLSGQMNIVQNQEDLMKSFSFLGPANLAFSGGLYNGPPSVNDTGTITND